MRGIIPLALLLSLCGCSELHNWLFGPSDYEIARNCGVSEQLLGRVRSEVKALKPYQGRPLGRCVMMRDEGRRVTVMLIEDPSKAVFR